MEIVTEGKMAQINKYQGVNSIVNEILCANTCTCYLD